MRRSFDGLAMLVQCVIQHDPLSGHVFVFRNKRGNMLKLLYWDRDGYAIWYKRLEKVTFSWPDHISENAVWPGSSVVGLQWRRGWDARCTAARPGGSPGR